MITYHIYLGTLAASALISAGLAVFFWRRIPAPGARAITALMAVTLVWSLGYILEMLSATLSDFRSANNIEYIGIVTIPVLWFIFTLQYTRHDSWQSRWLYVLAVLPLVTLALVWTNYLHGLMWHDARLETFGEFLIQKKTYGPWFWVHSSYSYLLVLLGFAMIIRRLLHPVTLYRNQIIVLLVGATLPLVWNVVYVLRAAPTYHVDMTAPAFAVSGMVLALGLFRFRILDIIPVARDAIFDSMNDGVVVFDRQNRLIDLNKEAEAIMGFPASKIIGKPASMLQFEHDSLERYLRSDVTLHTEITRDIGDEQRHYALSIIPLCNRQSSLLGRLVTLRDITESRRNERELRHLSNRLIEVQEEERRTIARELHDQVSQSLGLANIMLGKLSTPSGPKEGGFALKDVQLVLSEVIQQVREMTLNLRPGILDDLGLLAALLWHIDRFQARTGIRVDFTHEGLEGTNLPTGIRTAAYRIVQETLNNVLRHASTKEAKVGVRVEDNTLGIEVEDKGVGFDPAEVSLNSSGLRGIRERVLMLGGKLRIETSPGEGAKVITELPITGGR